MDKNLILATFFGFKLNSNLKYQTFEFVYVEVLMSIRVNITTVYCYLLIRGQFPYLDKLQDIGFIQCVDSQSDYQKVNTV